MVIKGKVHKFGDNINTDDIIAAKYLDSQDPVFLGSKCMENIAPDFARNVKAGDIIVAGKNFGCGSSREHAPVAIKGCGIGAVVAKSFARIFFRNAINIGLPIIELEDVSLINQNDILEINLKDGIIKNLTKNKIYKISPFPKFLEDIIKKGGLLNWIKEKR
ncbi:MAG: 3-isopropylmalate dehydratase small subunit [Candidatus Omnitrophica bacterium]|nr:3-isopropylmalate dehydratase small subunit [Candidatus Omnitrophota bacterium]MCM8830911.1 3-isopropylmalate dehydratase small subunit [Candidatus Omnitrophota bacterium]